MGIETGTDLRSADRDTSIGIITRQLAIIESLEKRIARPDVPPDNNAAERSLRPPVTSRKICGRTRSPQGTETTMTPASIFGTWRAQGSSTLTACRQLLATPQV